MKIAALGEFGLIDRIRTLFSRSSSRALVGMGDDAAVLRASSSKALLATKDLLLEGIHFDLALTDFYSLGWKSAAVNLSDIAAMGGTPWSALIGLGIPASVTVEQITEFYRGFSALADAHGCLIAGGDTSRSASGLVVSVTVLGEVERKAAVTRKGARPGDRIFVTGTLGDSAAGFDILTKKASTRRSKGQKGKAQRPMRYHPRERLLVLRHLRPEPRMEVGRKLARSRCLSSMIDVSDGLSQDLHHICEESGVGAELHASRIPLSPDLRDRAPLLGRSPLVYALSGGEDYELLFTVPERMVKRFRSLRAPAAEIGMITRKRGLRLVDGSGRSRRIDPAGFDHFKPSR